MGTAPPANSKRTIDLYISAIEDLIRDVEDAIEDLKYQEEGGEIIRAVDFTEVHSYIFPDEDVKSVAAFKVLSEAQQIALNLTILELIFFGGRAEGTLGASSLVVLPTPYRVELLGSESLFQRTTFERLANLATLAEGQISRLKIDSELQRITDDLKAADNSGQAAESRDLLVQIFNVLNEQAPELLLLTTLDLHEWSPQARLRKLLESAMLVNVDDERILGREIDLDELDSNMTEAIYQGLTHKRQEKRARAARRSRMTDAQRNRIQATSRIDALAVTLVVHVNSLLPQTRRLVLITRSKTLLDAVTDYAHQEGNERWLTFFRRPQAFAGTLLRQDSFTARRNTLEQRRLAFETVERAKKAKQAVAAGVIDKNQLENLAEELKRQYRSTVNLMVASTDWDLRSDRQVSDPRLRHLLAVLQGHFDLNSLIEEATKRVELDFTLANARLGQLLSGQSVMARDVGIEPANERQPSVQPVLIWSKRTPRTVALLFYHPSIQRARRMGMSGDRALRSFLQLGSAHSILRYSAGEEPSGNDRTIEQAKTRDIDRRLQPEVKQHSQPELMLERHDPAPVEVCLALGFLAAIGDVWAQAETYASMAINWSGKLDKTPRHEAYYLRAMARLRAANPTRERLEMGLADIERATEIRRQVESRPDLEDARYLSERGSHQFVWWDDLERPKRYGNSNHDNAMSELPVEHQSPMSSEHLRDAIALFDRAKVILDKEIEAARQSTPHRPDEIPGSLSRQLVDVANARCYIRIELGLLDDNSFMVLKDLGNAINICGWTDKDMPLSILDTKCWSMFNLRGPRIDNKALESAAITFARRLDEEKGRRPPRDLVKVEKHLKKIEHKTGWRLRPDQAMDSEE